MTFVRQAFLYFVSLMEFQKLFQWILSLQYE